MGCSEVDARRDTDTMNARSKVIAFGRFVNINSALFFRARANPAILVDSLKRS
jgi:hypothetical protein